MRGPLQLTVSDVAVIAQSHFGLTGAAISIGEQPVKELIDPAAMARMSVGEALTNIVLGPGERARRYPLLRKLDVGAEAARRRRAAL